MPEEETQKTKRTPGQAKKDHDYLTDMAHRAFGDDEEKCEKFVDSAMTRLGHKRITSYEDAEPEPDPESEQPTEPEDELAGSFEEGEEEPPQAHSKGKSYWRH